MYARQQAALAEFTQSVLADTSLALLMQQAALLIADTLAVAYSAIWELVPDRSTLMLRAWSGWPADALSATIPAALDSPAGFTVLSETALRIADWPSETRFSQPPLLRDHAVISSATVVVPGHAQPFGCLCVDVTASRAFNDEELHFLEVVANMLALAIDRAQTSQRSAQRLDDRTPAIEQQLVAAAQDQAVLEERQRFARDLHDSVTQALYGITLHAQAAWRLLSVGDIPTATDSLRALQHTAQEALDEMRLLIFELRSPILEQLGLVAALQARLNAVEGRANLQTLLVADDIGELPALVEQALYRIAQEALTNALKHAQAQHITVRLQQQIAKLTLEVSDDGLGFDPAVAGSTGGLGLRGIAERVAQLSGQLCVRSAPGTGTELCVEVAL